MNEEPPATFPPVGTRVRIADHSEAHGDEGVVFDSSPTICLIELDQGCIWPVCERCEIEVIDE